MNKTNWHIIQVAPSRTLKVHLKLIQEGFDVWTPYVRRHQKLTRMDKRKGISRRSYCHPIFGEFGFMFVGLPKDGYDNACYYLHEIIQSSRHIHGVVLSPIQGDLPPQWHIVPEKTMHVLEHGLIGTDGKVKIVGHGRSYDPYKDNSKATGRGVVEAREIPTFDPADVLMFREGPMQGIEFTALSAIGEKVQLEAVKGGWLGKVEANAFDLKRKVA